MMMLRAEIHRLSQILMSKGMAHEVAKFAQHMPGPRVMGQPTMPGSVLFLSIIATKLTFLSLSPWPDIQGPPFPATST